MESNNPVVDLDLILAKGGQTPCATCHEGTDQELVNGKPSRHLPEDEQELGGGVRSTGVDH